MVSKMCGAWLVIVEHKSILGDQRWINRSNHNIIFKDRLIENLSRDCFICKEQLRAMVWEPNLTALNRPEVAIGPPFYDTTIRIAFLMLNHRKG